MSKCWQLDDTLPNHKMVEYLRDTFGQDSALQSAKDVANLKASLKPKNGMLHLEQFLSALHSNDQWPYEIRKDSENNLTHLFLMHRKQVTMIRRFPYVFFSDGTFCTNEYDMPLYTIVGFQLSEQNIYRLLLFNAEEYD